MLYQLSYAREAPHRSRFRRIDYLSRMALLRSGDRHTWLEADTHDKAYGGVLRKLSSGLGWSLAQNGARRSLGVNALDGADRALRLCD